MNPMCKFIFKVFILVCCIIIAAPLNAHATFKPKYMHIAFDITRPIYYGLLRQPVRGFFNYSYDGAYRTGSIPMPKYNGIQYEFNSSVNWKRWILEGDFGFGNTEWKCKNLPLEGERFGESIYKNNGVYFRVGFNYNLVKDTPDNNSAFLGCRFAMSFFNDSLRSVESYSYDVDGKTSQQIQTLPKEMYMEQKNARALWWEFLTGVKVKLWEYIYTGVTLRYKFWLSVQNANMQSPFEIIGWGLNNDFIDTTVFGCNYYISFCIPFGNDEESK